MLLVYPDDEIVHASRQLPFSSLQRYPLHCDYEGRLVSPSRLGAYDIRLINFGKMAIQAHLASVVHFSLTMHPSRCRGGPSFTSTRCPPFLRARALDSISRHVQAYRLRLRGPSGAVGQSYHYATTEFLLREGRRLISVNTRRKIDSLARWLHSAPTCPSVLQESIET
ncbi:uncharacterized protein SCHCODRAFT_02610683 [Schizophyllum commune H4-8]|uniref:uncharacterized protein n=1 Tax=Schizophyllum commune (strain H4-8 / FGSC 9210) TaxID=578458 RepID=UPI00215F95D5|nr:uncharacterized protein SCHCODRAFT_02610683 [Schizophyllum commune H4-8]KAI5897943.1 hypothetical protein SCHCODRAFT_02610683 [Schizophyllum commune H4-8]